MLAPLGILPIVHQLGEVRVAEEPAIVGTSWPLRRGVGEVAIVVYNVLQHEGVEAFVVDTHHSML